MAEPITLPLQERIMRKNTLQKFLDLTIFFFLLSLLLYRILSHKDKGVTWLVAFGCESWFTFIWVLTLNAKWSPAEWKTYLDRLFSRTDELPPMDLFVTTADPVLEPPIITVNTVLSLLSVDYPSTKLACYVSDDAASPITFYSLVQASNFAKLWVPYCKKYKVPVRAPFQYFSSNNIQEISNGFSPEFIMDTRNMKNEYEQVCQRIEGAIQNTVSYDQTPDFAVFTKIDRRNHPSIVKVIWENNGDADGVPHLVYVSREKRVKHPHHYKAGAMNVLTRVSAVMTNSPIMLNVDCDMFANNPQIVLHGMCLLLGTGKERESGYVQCPQFFYGGLKDDPYGNQMVVLQECIGRGIAGIQGAFYGGTGCFHRRKVIYGLSPDESEIESRNSNLVNRKSEDKILESRFGISTEFTKSAAQLLSSGTNKNRVCPSDISSSLEAASKVADCSYESNTQWGKKVGWVYGSTTEDVLTGLRIHTKGWASVYCTPIPPGFLGCAPSSGPACMIQMKRWATGLLEILFTDMSPIIGTIRGNLRFRQCLVYLWINLWGPRSIPELCYATLPAYCLLTNTSFIPKVSEPSFLILGFLFVMYNISTLTEYLRNGLSVHAWWNNQRMTRINSASAWSFGVLSVILKLLGLSETVFEVTRKDQNTPDGNDPDINSGRFTFDDSPVFIPGTTLVLLHLTSIVVMLLRSWVKKHDDEPNGSSIGEIVCSVWVLLSFMPFVKGLFRKGIYGLPTSVICKSSALVALFITTCFL